MRKIISILLAVGLVLGMIAAAAPVGAQPPPYGTDWSVVGVTVSNEDCAGKLGTYNITITNTNATLTQGYHSVCVEFPDGTGFPERWRDGHILINGLTVFGAEITRTGNKVCFLVPTTIPAGFTYVTFQKVYDTGLGKTTGIRNPAAGRHFLFVSTSRATMSTPVKSGWNAGLLAFRGYLIKPAVSSYKWELDFSPTYEGIEYDFIPPFKACGQNDTGEQFDTWEDTTVTPSVWVTNFTLVLYGGSGCLGCDNMSAYVTLTSAPSGGRVRWYEDNAWAANLSLAVTGIPYYQLLDDVSLGAGVTTEWVSGLHFSKEGTYKLQFDLFWGGDPEECCVGCVDETREVEFVVHQWKDAAYIELDYKWNLFSLPIVPFDTSIESVLAPLATYFGVYNAYSSIWHYDRCADEWATYGNGQTSLTDIEDGKAYWIRMHKPGESLYSFFSYPVKLWVFGLKAPKAPSSPSAYPVCPGWNMIGFRATADMDESLYLWSVDGLYDGDAIYGWTAGAVQDWFIVETGNDLEVGLGYWIPFIDSGEIYPPLP